MRRTPLLASLLATLAFSPLSPLSPAACASFEKSYRDLTPEPPPALAASAPSPAADALIARFYGAGGVDPRSIAEALAREPGHSGLHEIAAFDALLRADKHAAFEHFLAAAADQNAVSPELYLWQVQKLARSTTDHLRAQALLRELMARHPRPAVRQLAAFDLARELRRVGEYEEAEALVGGLRFIDAWQVLGTFDNDQGKGFQTEYPPEQDADLARVYTGVRLPIRFRPIAVGKLDGALPLGDAMWPADSAVAYAQTFVAADRGRQLDLRITTTNAVRVWLNGQLVAADDKLSHEELDNVVARINLTPGWNRLLVKSAHETGPFRLAARITELDGSVPTDVRYVATATGGPTASAPAGAKGQPATGALVSPLGAIDKLADKNRKRFLEAQLWAREGHARRASFYLTPLLRDAPDNPVVMYFAAAALEENSEAGKALDLWNRGVAAHPEALAFAMERAHFNMGRRLWEKAQKDLEAVLAKNPAARDAMMDMATLYGHREWTIDRCQALEAVVAKWPDDADALAELGRCKNSLGYAEEAERALRRARALAPGETYILQRLLFLAQQRLDHGAADGLVRELRVARPSSPEFLLEAAELLRREGKPSESESMLAAAREASPDSPWAYDKLAQLAYEARRRPDAERWWRLALERDPENTGLAQRLATLSPTSLPLGDRLAPTADDIDRAVRSAEHVKVHPGSHAVLLLDDEVTTVNPDGGSKRIVTQVAEAVTTEGRDLLIQARLPTYGRVSVIEAFSVKKNGERQDASSIQGGTVRFRSFDVGSIAVLQYAHYAPPPHFLPNEFVQQWHFQSPSMQSESARWRVLLPADRTLNVETRGPVERSTEVIGDRKVWSFSARSAPPLVPEPSATPPTDELWMAAVSTLSSWDAYARWEAALLGEAFTASPELDALAKKLTADAKTPREKLDRLTAYVAQEIRYQQDYEDTIAGVKPHSAGMVLERGYGDCKDKAVLMIRLARIAGVELRFAVLRTTPFGKVLKQIPNQQFNHAIVYAPKQAGIDEGFFIDTTTNGLDVGNMRTDDEGALSLVIDSAGHWEFVPIPYQSADLEYARHDVKVDLKAPEKAVGHDHFEARGGVASGVRAMLRTGESAKKYYQGLSDQLFSGTTLIGGKADHDQDITRPVSVDLDIDLKNAVKPEDDRFRLDVPLLFPLAHSAALSTRQHPLRLWRGAESIAMDVDLGEGQQASHLPPDFSVEHACFTVSRASEVKGAHVNVRIRYKNTCAEIAPADYPAFRAAVQKVVARAQDDIVFGGKGKGAPAAKKKL
jgi:cellulose synthase operon protein C